MDPWLRRAGCSMPDTGKVVYGSLDGFGQNAGHTLDAWGKEMGKNLVLWSLGFTATGVASGSAAAAIHSMIGAVQARSIFALLQSAGAGEAGLAVLNGLASTGAVAGIGAIAAKAASEDKNACSRSKRSDTAKL